MPPAAQTRRELAARLLPLLDLTSLGEGDTPAQIESLCASARTPFGLPAAICVYPEHVTTVRRAMQAFIGRTGADELMVTSNIFDHQARLRSYAIAAQAMAA